MALEVHATARGIEHYLVAPRSWARSIENILQASVPAVRFEMAEVPRVAVRTADEYRLSDHNRPLLVDAAGVAGRLLSSLQPLESGEAIVVQWVITPHGPVPPIRNVTPEGPGQQPHSARPGVRQRSRRHDAQEASAGASLGGRTHWSAGPYRVVRAATTSTSRSRLARNQGTRRASTAANLWVPRMSSSAISWTFV